MQPDINSLKQKIQANRDFISRIAAGIPGFKGYVEKSENYNADRMIREFVISGIAAAKKGLGIISGDLTREQDISFLPEIDSLNSLLERLYKKIEFAEYGSAGAFSKLKISDDDQNRLLEFDWRLISLFDGIGSQINELQSLRGEPLKSGLKSVKTALLEFEKTFDERKYVIMEVI